MKVQEIQNFTPTDFQAKNFTPQIQSFSDNNKKKSKICFFSGEIYTAGKSFTLPLGVTGGTNLHSAIKHKHGLKL